MIVSNKAILFKFKIIFLIRFMFRNINDKKNIIVVIFFVIKTYFILLLLNYNYIINLKNETYVH